MFLRNMVKTRSFSKRLISNKSKLPLKVGSINILDLGTVVNRDGFHTERFIFSVGYIIRRLCPSAVYPDKYTVMTAKILDRNHSQLLMTTADQPDNTPIASSIPRA
ncbi:uncharacterized protein B0P05DRAFT_583186 [Gilbertella persicaria]|uniref:uncharacterized protein n=1 Tax=Gilbertella persicaria TaxID=101096 RepID=UPI00221F09D2|nr:uncharacterized protein B0P05DRAFT_583186 [Gilbertella persicaria]KAI8094918.1 hypothetical protein B0P05DRAFT_583186 [Gilbertella persicaria]